MSDDPECVYERIIQDEYFDDLKDDKIIIKEDIIEQAMQNKPDAIHTIGCEYALMKNHEKALMWLGTSAALGFQKSQLELGHLFVQSGNDECALDWYMQAERNGLISDPFCIAKIMLKLERYEEAREYFQTSANVGNIDAQFQLALIYYNGWCIDRFKHDELHNAEHRENSDKREAKACFVQCAKQGNSEAAYYIGRMYENGEGVSVDKYQALAWYHEARGYKPADECIDCLHKQGYIHVAKGEDIISREDNSSSTLLMASLGFVVVFLFYYYLWYLVTH